MPIWGFELMQEDNKKFIIESQFSLDSPGPIGFIKDFVGPDPLYAVGSSQSSDDSNVTIYRFIDPKSILWQKYWDYDGYEVGVDIDKNDTTIFVLANINGSKTSNFDMAIVFFSYDGDFEDLTIIGSKADDEGNEIKFYNGAIYIVGITYKYDANGDAILIKLSTSGEEIWNKTIGGSLEDEFYDLSIIENEIVAVGYTTTNDGVMQPLIVKFDLNGNVLWSVTLDKLSGSIATAVYTLDNRIYVGGYNYQDKTSTMFIAILRSDGIVENIFTLQTQGVLADLEMVDETFETEYFNEYHRFLYVTGYFGNVGFVAKYDLTGGLIWSFYTSEDYETKFFSIINVDYYITVGGESNKEGSLKSTVIVFQSDDDGDSLGMHDEKYLGTNPFNLDTDYDGLNDSAEIDINTDPLDYDTDDDGLSDGDEYIIYHTDPLDMDTDDDGYTDGEEVWSHSDPLNPEDYPKEDSGITINFFGLLMVFIFIISPLILIVIVIKKALGFVRKKTIKPKIPTKRITKYELIEMLPPKDYKT